MSRDLGPRGLLLLAAAGLGSGVLLARAWPRPPEVVRGPPASRPVAAAAPRTSAAVARIAPPNASSAASSPAVVSPSEAAPVQRRPRPVQSRPASEWQGMLVSLADDDRPPCERSEGCGRALACGRDGRCGPCARDAECETGERCVLDHCLRSGDVGCRVAAQCGAGEVCWLSGLSEGPRGNEAMRSNCLPPVGGVDDRDR